MPAPKPKPTILEIAPYRAGRAAAPGYAHPIKLSANENALGASPVARAAYIEAAANLHLYPDPSARALREALAVKHGLDPARIVFGTGSDEIFAMACQAYLSPGDIMVEPQWAFAAWGIAARASGAEVRRAPERDYHVDVDAMLAAVDARTKVMFVANPANPTGSAIPAREIRRLHAGLREDILLVLDEAYAEFSVDQNSFEVFADAPNVLVTRTFSKLYGLAGLRVGWGYGPAPVLDALNRIRLPFNAAAPAQAAALAALADEAFATASIAHAVRGRKLLAEFISRFGLKAVPSAANFVTAIFPDHAPVSAGEVSDRLVERGILVRGLEPYGMANALRISVGAQDEMAAFEAAFEAALSSKA